MRKYGEGPTDAAQGHYPAPLVRDMERERKRLRMYRRQFVDEAMQGLFAEMRAGRVQLAAGPLVPPVGS